jgi:hypothetical protein
MMTRQQTLNRSIKAITGATLLSLGLLLLLANLDEVVARSSSSLASPAGSLGTVLELSLAALRVTQVYVFDPSRFQSGLQQILLSFWPLVLVFMGAGLLQVVFKGRFTARALGESSEREIAHE